MRYLVLGNPRHFPQEICLLILKSLAPSYLFCDLTGDVIDFSICLLINVSINLLCFTFFEFLRYYNVMNDNENEIMKDEANWKRTLRKYQNKLHQSTFMIYLVRRTFLYLTNILISTMPRSSRQGGRATCGISGRARRRWRGSIQGRG